MRTRTARSLILAYGLATSLSAACAPRAESPRLRLLGIVQDGGLPQPACNCANCRAARGDLRHKHYVASLALVIPPSERGRQVYLIDAGPDLREQLQLLDDLQSSNTPTTNRRPVDGILLTHAHIGHYLGLAWLGFEAVNTQDLPVFASPRMAAFLRDNGPWSQLVRLRNIDLHEWPAEKPQLLPCQIEVTPVNVPHRDEYSDTFAFIFRRADASPVVLYMPDCDPWNRWSSPLTALIEKYHVTTAILDGTFYSPAELPDRDLSTIRHPLITDTMDLLEPLVRAGRLTVYFTHLNHTNPALNPSSPESRHIRARGFAIAREGLELPLSQ